MTAVTSRAVIRDMSRDVAAVTRRDRGRLEQEGTSEASAVYVCVLFSHLCLPLTWGLAGEAANTTRGTDPLLPRVGTNVQRRRGVGSPPTGSAEARRRPGRDTKY